MPKDQKTSLPLVAPGSVPPERLATAFSALESSLSKLQRDTLSAMYHATDHSLPIDGDGQYSIIINAFGKIGGKISRQLDCQPDGGYHLYWIASQLTKTEGSPPVWKMRENLVKALSMLGW